jgi:hypothetical protein
VFRIKTSQANASFGPPPEKTIHSSFSIDADLSITTTGKVPIPLLISWLPELKTREAAQIYKGWRVPCLTDRGIHNRGEEKIS